MTKPAGREHELEILRGVANGFNASELERMGPWTREDIDHTLQRYHLVTLPGGTIVKADTPIPVALQVAGRSPSPQVRKLAARASSAMVALAGELAKEHAGHAAEDVQRSQRHAVIGFVEVLKQLQRDAEHELERLRDKSPQSRAARTARAQAAG